MEPIANERQDARLLERERELQTLRAAMERLVAGEGSMLLVEGPAGIGKTRLLERALSLADQRSVLARAARAGQLEREMPFGVARQLLEPVIERADASERARLLAGSAALSMVAFGRGDEPDTGSERDPYAPIHGLYWLVANLCDSAPAVLVIDDAHWADGESLRWVDYLARRAADTAVLLVVGARTGEADEPVELEALRLDAAEIIRPVALSPAAIDELIAAELGSVPSDEFSRACSTATGGNPFLLAEVLRTLRSRSVGADAEGATAVGSLGPEPVARSVLQRLHGFGDDAVSMARAIAVLGGAPQIRHLSGLAGVDEERARELCDRLRQAELVAPGQPIDFVHPLIRTAIYRELSEDGRAAAHRRAAELIDATRGDARELAPHLMVCAPNGDPWVVDRLREAAREATAAGAPEAARRYLERALAEPAPDELGVTYELGRAAWGSNPLEAPDLLVSVAERAEDAALRLRALEDAAWAYFDCGNLERAVHWFGELVKAIPAGRAEDTLAAEASLYCLRALNVGRRPEDSARIAATVAAAGARSRGELLARGALSFERFMACAPVDEVVELAASLPPPPWAGRGAVPGIACRVLAWCGRWDIAREATARGWESARSVGLVHVASYRESTLGEISRLAGSLVDSEAEARTASDIVRDLPASLPTWAAIAGLLATLIARGAVDEATKVGAAWDLSAPFSVVPMAPVPLEIRGTLRLARGELEAGAEDLLAVGEDLESMRLLNPAAVPWRQEVVPALAALDRADEARRIVAEGQERARAFGAPHVVGAMLRARSSTEPGARAIESLLESAEILERSGPPHELARTLLELGAAQRRGRRRTESREPLRRALELATASGADGIAARARDELAAAGSRPRSVFRTGVDSLTASELRTAKLAAQGLGNVEIAQQLFVTRKTVEKHLGNAYAKLEISSRDGLPEALEP
jgi:DNA-binding CsgD family transcriptional regulator